MIQVPSNWTTRRPELLPDRDVPYRLLGVYERTEDGIRDDLVLAWQDSHLWFRADADTDTIEVGFHESRFEPTSEFHSLEAVPPWIDFLGHDCGWTWCAVNQQGYFDSILISFDGIVPNVMLHVIGSSIKVFTIAPT